MVNSVIIPHICRRLCPRHESGHQRAQTVASQAGSGDVQRRRRWQLSSSTAHLQPPHPTPAIINHLCRVSPFLDQNTHPPPIRRRSPPTTPHSSPLNTQPSLPLGATMSDQLKDLADLPREFLKDGTQFINRCTKRTSSSLVLSSSIFSLSLVLRPCHPRVPSFFVYGRRRRGYACPFTLSPTLSIRQQLQQRRAATVTHSAKADMHHSRQARVPQDQPGRRCRFPSHGRHWLHCQAEYDTPRSHSSTLKPPQTSSPHLLSETTSRTSRRSDEKARVGLRGAFVFAIRSAQWVESTS